ncbi:MAG: long-chain fatty acid--CoA ligase [Armatimonadetes bacterium]|nr:long-chain fatty acid--CoA ligase [Armatimonadota bacterium]
MLSLPGILLGSCEKWGDRPAQSRKLNRKFASITYNQLRTDVHRAAAVLKSLGVKPGVTVAIFGESSPEWATVDWAITSLGAISVPIFPTLMPDTVEYILRDSGAALCFVGDNRLMKKFDEAVNHGMLRVTPVVMEPNADAGFAKMIAQTGVGHFPMREWEEECHRRNPNEIAAIIYTSGTTGEPKGAELTHEAFGFQCASIRKNLPVDSTDRFLSFLPLSHVYERLGGHYFPISCGAEIAYAESLKTLAQDLVLAKPTIVTAVPRFLEGVRAKLISAAKDAPLLKRLIFFAAMNRGPSRLKNNMKVKGLFDQLLDGMVAVKIRARFGGRLRFLVSGGAALPLDLAEFYAAFGVKILQGYGLTETAPVISINHPDRNLSDSVGEVLEGVEVRVAGDGEILMRGPSRMVGYHCKPEETAAAIDAEGWFHTGDIGRLEGSRLWITDRKKDIIVMSNGKNVAPAMIENRLKSSLYIDEAMVLGDGEDRISALIVPAFDALRHYCHNKSLEGSHVQEMIEHPDVAQLLKREVESANKHLADYEKVKSYRLMSAPWTQETGELTPSLKVRRKLIKEKFAEEVRALRK